MKFQLSEQKKEQIFHQYSSDLSFKCRKKTRQKNSINLCQKDGFFDIFLVKNVARHHCAKMNKQVFNFNKYKIYIRYFNRQKKSCK